VRPSAFRTTGPADIQKDPAAVYFYAAMVRAIKREAAMTPAAACKPVKFKRTDEGIVGTLRNCIDFFFFNRYHGFCNHQWRVKHNWCVGWGQKPIFGRGGFCSFLWVRLPIITKKHPFLKESDGLSVRMIEGRMPLSVKNFYAFTRS
jgi:hypothetical protein